MKARIAAAAAIGLVLLAGVWYVFRPDLLFINQRASEGFPGSGAATGQPAPGAARPLVAGRFKGHAHETEGTAAVFEVDGNRILRLTNFKTSNGPDVHVYLVAASDVEDDATVKRAGFIDLGPMKGNIGDQNYSVPAVTDLATYQTVTIWCVRFNVNFGSAPLRAAS